MVETKNIDDSVLQEATAKALAESRLLGKDSTNKPLYIVRAQDITLKAKYRVYAVLKIREDAIGADIVGFELSLDNANKLTTISEALELVNKKSLRIVNKKIPWTKVLDIENRSFKYAK